MGNPIGFIYTLYQNLSNNQNITENDGEQNQREKKDFNKKSDQVRRRIDELKNFLSFIPVTELKTTQTALRDCYDAWMCQKRWADYASSFDFINHKYKGRDGIIDKFAELKTYLEKTPDKPEDIAGTSYNNYLYFIRSDIRNMIEKFKQVDSNADGKESSPTYESVTIFLTYYCNDIEELSSLPQTLKESEKIIERVIASYSSDNAKKISNQLNKLNKIYYSLSNSGKQGKKPDTVQHPNAVEAIDMVIKIISVLYQKVSITDDKYQQWKTTLEDIKKCYLEEQTALQMKDCSEVVCKLKEYTDKLNGQITELKKKIEDDKETYNMLTTTLTEEWFMNLNPKESNELVKMNEEELKEFYFKAISRLNLDFESSWIKSQMES